jgi:chemotaxis protein histidine kinase CheA/ActR/RegA family two-component response regulator
MPAPTTPDPNEINLVELQLQQELRAMFEVDSQKYLEDYLHLVQRLQPLSWTKDIQELYRLIHTIKGSAVTVGADAILRVSTVLEDMLSDLRHVNPAPPLEDGKLGQMLLEAGELLAGSLQVRLSGEEAVKSVQPSVQRIQTLREQTKQRYLPEWNEQSLLHQEFAEQGFGLVVLDLEMALEQMPRRGDVAGETVEIARQTMMQLTEIGKDLQFASGWTQLLGQCEDLLSNPSIEIWRSQWMGYLNALKESARQSGKFVEPVAIALPELETQESAFDDAALLELSALDTSLLDFEEVSEVTTPEESAFDESELLELTALDASLLDFEEVSEVTTPEESAFDESELLELSALDTSLLDFEEISEVTTPEESIALDFNELAIAADALQLSEAAEQPTETTVAADELTQLDLETLTEITEPLVASDVEMAIASPEVTEDWSGLIALPTQIDATPTLIESAIAAAPLEPQGILPTSRVEIQNENIQIPVPLNRLDSTARNLIDALLTARASQGFYQNLQAQLTQLFALAKESTQYITRLRQIQDDYALLDTLKRSSTSAEGPALESYRQGYSTINRLLETSLRLSELGAEAEKTASLTSDSLQSLDRNILRLRQTVEQSRLVPFKNLAFRARAILRDLTTRFNKPARLVIEGEQIELDAGTSSKLEPALLHLIRNAYDHGLESASDRLAQGKPEQGTITISLKRKGNSYLLDVGDDGRGIDAEAIARSAQAKKLPLYHTQTPAELLAVICQPGFSSKATVSDISGRGVGMDVVADRVTGLGGRMSLETLPGMGTNFRLQFPVPHLLVSCVLVQAGDRTFAVPTQDISTTDILGNLQATQVSEANTACSWRIQQGETTLLGLDLLEYWQSQAAGRLLSDTAVCLYVRPSEQSQGLWVLADELLGQTELLISPLPSPLVTPIGLLGVSLQPNGSLVPVVEIATLADALLDSPGKISQSFQVQTETAVQDAAPIQRDREEVVQLTRTILVVDDAALMRRRIEASLTAYGYAVNTCADGQEAWNWLQTNPTPAMVITDIEMPNMDGFTLIDRARLAGITIPMVVVSSRLAEEWSKEARRLGATDYLTKGFTTADLVNKVKSILGGGERT